MTFKTAYLETPRKTDIHLATRASMQDGLFRIRTTPTPVPAEVWRANMRRFDSGYVAELGSGRVGLFYGLSERLAGTATTALVGRYLDEAHIPHKMRPLPGPLTGWMAATVESSLHTVPVCVGDVTNMRDYTFADTAEFVGSALYAVFHTLRVIDPAEIHTVQCSTNEPRPFPA